MKSILNFIDNINNYIQPLFYLMMLLSCAMQILVRLIPTLKASWTMELIIILFGAAVWMAINLTIREDTNSGITLLLDFLPTKWQKVLIVFHMVLFTILLIFFVLFSAEAILKYYRMDMRTPSIQAPLYFTRLPLFLGSILGLGELVRKIKIVLTDEKYIDKYLRRY